MSTRKSHTLAYLTSHTHDPNTLVLHTPPGLATDMGRFEPARYDAELRAYLVHTDHHDALHRFATSIGLHITDNRIRPPTAPGPPRPRMPECTHCAQPARHDTHPNRCPNCGQPWQPTYPPDHHAGHGVTQDCPACGRTQHGRFAHCGRCGAAIPDEPPTRRRTAPRPTLPDPLPLAQTIDDLAEHLDHDQEGDYEPPF